MENRTCSKCGTEKPLETGYYRNSKSRGSWTAHCRGCHQKRRRKPPRAPEGFKKCTACGDVKAATADHWHLAAKGKYGLAARCRPCKLVEIARVNTPERKKEYYEANKAAIIDHQGKQKKVARQADLEGFREREKAYRDANRVKYREQMRAGKATRTAKKRASGGQCTQADIEKMKGGQKGMCWWCQKPYGRFHLDHRIPVSKGGSSNPNNLVLSCAPCNQSKSARMPWQIDNPRLL